MIPNLFIRRPRTLISSLMIFILFYFIIKSYIQNRFPNNLDDIVVNLQLIFILFFV